MKIRQNDRLPILEAKAFTKTGFFNLTIFATITFSMTDGAGNDISGNASGSEDGTLSYSWASGDTAVPGTYRGRFLGTDASGRTQSFPADEDIIVEILPFPLS